MRRLRSRLRPGCHRQDRRKVNDGTTDQYYRLVFSVLDALRFDRDWRGSARTVALCSDGASSLYRAASAGLFESWNFRDAHLVGRFLQGLIMADKQVFGRVLGVGII